MEIWEEINYNEQALEDNLNKLGFNCKKSAEAEREYRIAKAQLMLKLRQQGMPITLIPDLVKGDKDVSLLALQRDIAEGIYKANLEAINIYKKKSDDLRLYFEKEYSRKD